jgi:hypothetical protein
MGATDVAMGAAAGGAIKTVRLPGEMILVR